MKYAAGVFLKLKYFENQNIDNDLRSAIMS
jgi:hypothetical protein